MDLTQAEVAEVLLAFVRAASPVSEEKSTFQQQLHTAPRPGPRSKDNMVEAYRECLGRLTEAECGALDGVIRELCAAL